MTGHADNRDELVHQALALWGPRVILGGVDFNDFEAARSELDRWADWIDFWCGHGDKHRLAAERCETQGNALSAGLAYRRAAACYHFAKFVWVDDEAKNRIATEAAVACNNKALRLLDPSHRRIQAGAGEFRVIANLRIPPGADDPFPLVVLIPGLDSTKEEFPSWEQVFLDRGLATLTVDGPGQGEVFHLGTRIQPAYDRSLEIALDAVSPDPRVDMTRVGVAGTSLGGHYAARAAAFVDRVRAVIAISPPYAVTFGSAPAHTRAALRFYARTTSDDDAQRHLADLNLEGIAARITQPAIFATGRQDRIVPWEQTKAIASETPNGRFLLYDDGNHALTNKAHEVRDMTADWMKAQLGMPRFDRHT